MLVGGVGVALASDDVCVSDRRPDLVLVGDRCDAGSGEGQVEPDNPHAVTNSGERTA